VLPEASLAGASAISAEESAFHLLLLDPAGKAVAGGRLHLNNPDEAQVRYTAVDEDARGRGYGGRILKAEAETLFGVIRHWRTEKVL
jgi:N-acetylglutamate synthase-like GNAT family acetyltransferase